MASSLPLHRESSDLVELKRKLQEIIDQFAIRLTAEDETCDTSVHCSIMSRQMTQDPVDLESTTKDLNHILDKLDDYPVTIIKICAIQVRVGNQIHNVTLRNEEFD